jgi:peptide/nickel transport system substrate-binding protein
MPSSVGHLIRVIVLVALLTVPLAGAARVVAQEPLVLRVGTTQDLDSLNPYNTALVVGYEVFLLSYDLLVSFGPDLEPYPGFADRWEYDEEQQAWVVHIREGMLWSDGEPATSADACYSFQLNIDANDEEDYVGLGYINPSVGDYGITRVECPDPQTILLFTEDPSDRPLQTYVPILPEHIFGDIDYVAMADETFDAPLVGTGPYQAVEWRTGQSITFQRNPHYWGDPPAADTVVIQIFRSTDTMFQALRRGELDYASGINAPQFNQLQGEPDIATVEGKANGWTQLGFNTYGTGTGNTIENGGPSTTALLDPAFRDALGYAIDKELLAERILDGYGDVGTTPVPPVLAEWHVPPDNLRTFDIEIARQRLADAGYETNANGQLLDHEGQPIALRLFFPDSAETYAAAAQFIESWFGELGIRVTSQQFDSGTLVDRMLPPEAGDEYNADYDMFIWGWAGYPDPSGLLEIFRCDAIGSSSDTMYCNPEYDQLYRDQLAEIDPDARREILARMQNLIYDEAVYHILFYDSDLVAYRTDRFAGWQNQPADGTPLFTYSTLGYTLLTEAGAEPEPTEPPVTPTPAAETPAGTPPAGETPAATPPEGTPPAETPAPSPAPGEGTGGIDPMLLLVLVALIVLAGGGFVLLRRRRIREEEE